MTVYIPSYFNNLVDREILFKESINSYLKLGFTIKILWMNKDFKKINNSSITYIESEPKNASEARNQLLSIFYNTEEDYCYLSDDDTKLLKLIEEEEDCVSIVNDKRLSLVNTTNISSALLKLKNLRKYYKEEIYFDESLEANQDFDFAKTLLTSNFKTKIVNTKNVIINRGVSSMFSSPQNRLYKKEQSLKIINNKKYGIKDI